MKDNLDLTTVHTVVCYKVQSSPFLKKVTRHKIEQFCMDLCLVALSVRTGYLFDAFTLHDSQLSTLEVFTKVMSTLRETLPVFNSVTLVHEPVSEQLFFVNIRLLQSRCRLQGFAHDSGSREVYSDAWTSFVQLLPTPTLLPSPPPRIPALLHELCLASESDDTLPLSIILSPSLKITDIVPLAAFLLEYPVAYVPASVDQTEFLAGAPLDIYECFLTRSLTNADCSGFAGSEHTLLKCSCPSVVAGADGHLLSSMLTERLRCRFGPRIEATGSSGTLIVRHRTDSFPRVAL
ncbi:hypothetical protein AcW2_007427 [Taiwanofungus camphoratus]|nr:hypothetical protein AcW2_007427 [Antrodia cinnamomea]